jgi:hypothetical protein
VIPVRHEDEVLVYSSIVTPARSTVFHQASFLSTNKALSGELYLPERVKIPRVRDPNRAASLTSNNISYFFSDLRPADCILWRRIGTLWSALQLVLYTYLYLFEYGFLYLKKIIHEVLKRYL